jgi:hypothetical protein
MKMEINAHYDGEAEVTHLSLAGAVPVTLEMPSFGSRRHRPLLQVVAKHHGLDPDVLVVAAQTAKLAPKGYVVTLAASSHAIPRTQESL